MRGSLNMFTKLTRKKEGGGWGNADIDDAGGREGWGSADNG